MKWKFILLFAELSINKINSAEKSNWFKGYKCICVLYVFLCVPRINVKVCVPVKVIPFSVALKLHSLYTFISLVVVAFLVMISQIFLLCWLNFQLIFFFALKHVSLLWKMLFSTSTTVLYSSPHHIIIVVVSCFWIADRFFHYT